MIKKNYINAMNNGLAMSIFIAFITSIPIREFNRPELLLFRNFAVASIYAVVLTQNANLITEFRDFSIKKIYSYFVKWSSSLIFIIPLISSTIAKLFFGNKEGLFHNLLEIEFYLFYSFFVIKITSLLKTNSKRLKVYFIFFMFMAPFLLYIGVMELVNYQGDSMPYSYLIPMNYRFFLETTSNFLLKLVPLSIVLLASIGSVFYSTPPRAHL